jgi:hypothetical protein
MRFTPITLFSADGNFTEPCIVARGTECTSGSFYAGAVRWDWFDYTGSGAFTGSISQSQFIIETGSTSRAVILTVGGGGAGAVDDDGGGGGAGGVGLHEGITVQPNTYTVGVGGGGGGVRASSVEPSGNGNDGQDSYFLGGPYTGSGLTSAGGEGGFGNSGVNLDGGRSGENYGNSFTNGNSSGATGVAGIGFGGAGARTAVTASNAFGYGFFIQFANQDPNNLPLTDNILLALGGGGEGSVANQPPGDDFGAGSYRGGLYPPGDAESNTGGGGGAGIAFKNTAPFEDTYWSSNGGSGRVIVFVPTNLCSSSLYTTPDVDKLGLTQWIDIGSGRTFGKNFNGNIFEDIIRPKQNMFASGDINTSNSGSLTNLRATVQYTSSFGIVDTNFFPSSSKYPIDKYLGIEDILQANVISSETPFFNLANNFSLEWCGYQIPTAGTGDSNQIFGIITGSGNPDNAVSPFFPNLSMRLKKDGSDTVVNLLKQFEPSSSTASLDINVTSNDGYPSQYVITYESSSREVNLYNNSLHLVSMSNVEFPSQYDLQWAPFMDDQPNEVIHAELRLYNRVISTGSMLQNLEASFSGSYAPVAPPCESYRFTAGGDGGTASYELCNSGTTTTQNLPPGTNAVHCITSGSSRGITGVDSQITFLGTC